MALRLRKNDMVSIIAGEHKGQTGRIIKVFPDKNRVCVEARNLVKRHTKPNRKSQQGGIVEKEASIHISNVLLLCPKTNKPTRLGMQILENGKRVRFSKKAKEMID
jgi:large subunit ribosomal protein L24